MARRLTSMKDFPIDKQTKIPSYYLVALSLTYARTIMTPQEQGLMEKAISELNGAIVSGDLDNAQAAAIHEIIDAMESKSYLENWALMNRLLIEYTNPGAWSPVQ